MENNTITIAWGQITIASLICSLFGFLIGNRLALGRDRKKEFINAGITFRKAFSEEIRLLMINHPNHFSGGDIYRKTNNLIVTSYKKHQQAYIDFLPFVNKWKRNKFEECWHLYCCYEKGQPTFKDYITRTPKHYEEVEKRELALRRIKDLFKYTK